MNHKSDLHISSNFCLLTPYGQAYPDDPAYTISMNIVVTDDNGKPVPNVTVNFQTAGLNGDRTQFFDADSESDDVGGHTAQKKTDSNGVAAIRFCCRVNGIIDLVAYIDMEAEPVSEGTIVCSNEVPGTLNPLLLASQLDNKLLVQENEFSFRVSTTKSGTVHDTDRTVVILNRTPFLVPGDFSRLTNQGAQIPYHSLTLNENVRANNIYYMSQATAGTAYVSRHLGFAVIGVPTAMPDPAITGYWPGPRPQIGSTAGTITDGDLVNGNILTIHIPFSGKYQLRPHDKVTFWIYVNGWTAGNNQSKKAYSRSFDYIVPPDHDPESTLVITLSAQYFYNYSRHENGVETENRAYMNYRVNDLLWSSAWSGSILTDPQ